MDGDTWSNEEFTKVISVFLVVTSIVSFLSFSYALQLDNSLSRCVEDNSRLKNLCLEYSDNSSECSFDENRSSVKSSQPGVRGWFS